MRCVQFKNPVINARSKKPSKNDQEIRSAARSYNKRNIMKLSFALTLLPTTLVWAADPTPLDLKTGEWEYTVTMQMTGMPQPSTAQVPQIPAEQLAKLPPEQRAKIEAALKQAGNMASGKPSTTTSRNCVKKEDLVRLNPLSNADKSCKMTVISSSHNKLEAKIDCDSAANKSTSTMTIEASSSESSKFRVVSTGTAEGRPMNMTIDGTGKWLSATCTDTK
jgi:Protein of unknown function (DUF3617)